MDGSLRLAVGGLWWFALLGCTSVLGIDDSQKNAVAELCKCVTITGCQQILDDRLKRASEETRAAWMQKYTAECSKHCSVAMTCIAAKPTCTLTGDTCLVQDCSDCCTTTTSGTECS